MTDASGINTDAYQAELQAAADSLVAVFPKDFQSKFKVYDFGFYLHNESYSGGYPEAFAQAIADVSAKSSYYLLFGKQTDHSGVYTKFWVDLKLPTTGKLSCLPAPWVGYIKNKISNISNSSTGDPLEFAIAENAGMRYLREYIKMKVECCKGKESAEYCGNDQTFVNPSQTNGMKGGTTGSIQENRLLGFILLHASGHLAGISHGSYQDFGYLDNGAQIARNIYRKDWNFEDLITETFFKYKYIIDATKQRFIDGSTF